MIIIKYICIFLILIISIFIGTLYSKKYSNRVNDLEEMKNALNIFEAKIKYTYKPIPEVFKDISNIIKPNIGKIFIKASDYMKNESASSSWEKALEECKDNTNLNNDDIEILKNLSKTLGNTDLEGQVSSIKLTSNFLDNQIKISQEEKNKNSKLFRTLGAGIGISIAIILV